jgi:hypothetical protein
MQYSHNEGKLPNIIHTDATQPFHFAVLTADVKAEGQEYMIYQVSTYPGTRELCGIFHGLFINFRELFGEDPKSFESQGVRAAFKFNTAWNAILMLFSPYRYPESFLYQAVLKLSYVLSRLFRRPSLLSAQFAHKSLIAFSKAMTSVDGISSVLATWNPSVPQKLPNLLETDSILVDVGPKDLVAGVLDGLSIDKRSIFVFGRILYSTMTDSELIIAELLVANMNETTAEKETTDGRLFCMARHFHTVMVTITEKGRGLEKCCQMQVALMRLDAQGLISKMQQAFAKKLPPVKALDVLVVSGPFTLTNPPFIEAPLFAQKDLLLEANAVAAEMYEKLMKPGFKCIVDYAIKKTDFRVKFVRHGDTLTFIHTSEDVDEQELRPIPHMLKSIRMAEDQGSRL